MQLIEVIYMAQRSLDVMVEASLFKMDMRNRWIRSWKVDVMQDKLSND